MFVDFYNKTIVLFNNVYSVLDYYAYLHMKPMIIARWKAISNYLIECSNKTENHVFEPNLWVNLFFDIFGLIWCVFGLIVFFVFASQKLFKNINLGKDTYLANYVHLDDLEEEVGSIDDAAHYFLFFVLIISWFYFFTVFARFFIIKHFYFILSAFMCIVVSGFLVPSALLVQMSLQFTQYVRGSGRSTNVLFETILDAVSVSVIMIRFFVQNIRFVFIFLAFFELYEFTLDISLRSPVNMNLWINWSDAVFCIQNYGLSSYLLFKIFVSWFLYIYYLGHLTILFIIQLAIYFVLSFWLYFFLYTTFLLNSHEKYFFFKKAISK